MKHITVGILAAAALLAVGHAGAADKWLNKRDAEELFAYIDINNCPLSTEEVTENVHTMLVRSRIKPLSKWSSGDVVLYVVLDCTDDKADTWLFNQTVMLAKIKDEGGDGKTVSFRHDDQSQTFGKGGESFIRGNLEKAIDASFMQYLNANFDLAPDD